MTTVCNTVSVLWTASFCGTCLQNSILGLLVPGYLRMCSLYTKAEAGSWGCAALWEHSLGGKELKQIKENKTGYREAKSNVISGKIQSWLAPEDLDRGAFL